MRLSGVLLLLVASFVLQGCFGIFSKEERRIKSPCVRLDGQSECERHPVNKWWRG